MFAKLSEKTGQATVEYVVVLAALLAVVVGLGALSGLVRDGVVVAQALFSASHHVAGEAVGMVLDVFAF